MLGSASTAQAHNYLISSTPEAGEVLAVLPERFEITTNEALLTTAGTGGFALEVRDAAGLYYGDGCVTIDGATMSASAALGEPGEYTVIWQVVSADGHTVSEEYPFTWAPADGTANAASPGSSSVPLCDGDADSMPLETAPLPGDAPGTGSTENANLSNVLWIGGAVVLVGATIGLTLVLSGRKKK